VGLHFANPVALVLLGLLVLVVVWVRRSLAGLGKVRGAVALALRVAITLLIVLALARLQWSMTQDDLSVIYVLDRSQSIPVEAQKQALEFVRESQKARRTGDTAGLVVFGRRAALERPAAALPLLSQPVAEPAGARQPDAGGEKAAGEVASLQSVVSGERTNMASGLRLALGAFPVSGRQRIVLISDGNENIGAATEEAEAARKNGVRVDVLPVHYRYEQEVMVEKVLAPANVDRGEAFEVRTVVWASTAQPARLHLYENGTLIGSTDVELKEGRNVFVVERKLPEPGYYSYSATVEAAEDTLYANNSGSAFSLVRGEGRVLYLEGDPQHAQELLGALQTQGLAVRLSGLDVLPLSLGELIPYDTVILSDVPASSLGEEGMRVLELAVKDWGVGLVMVGSENSFGPGGYQDSPVERALPVSMDIKQRRVMPSGALVIVLHTCEIPEGNYWAQQIALAALRVLSATDEFGVIYYDWRANEQWLFPLQRAADKTALAQRIGGVAPGDMPSFITSLEMAHRALKASSASVKHVVIISDGDPAYPDDTAVLDMVADGITVSTVAISPHSQTDTARLAHVAMLGQGRYYEPQSSATLPEIFIKEAATVRRSLIFEEAFTPRAVLASELTTGISPQEYPSLGGYVCTTGKELAEVPLITHHDDPLLAHWQYGLGRTVAFTSDAKPRWAVDWVGWGKFAQFWAQVVRWSSRRVGAAGVRVQSEVKDDRAHLVVEAIDADGRFVNGLRFSGTVVTPANKERALAVEQTGPGRYEATFDVEEPGTHYLSLHYTDEKGQSALHTDGLVVPYSAEFRELGANEALLSTLAQMTGGRVLATDSDVFARTFPPAPHWRDAWPLLLLVGALLVPADVFVRRVFVDWRAVWAGLLVVVRWLPVVGRRGVRAARPAYVSALLGRKRRTREELARRGRKFEPSAEAPLEEPAVAAGAQERKPEIAPAARPAAEVSKPAVEREEETYTGRLLRAKRKALRQKDAEGGAKGT
jgi:uncharacterized membrane protein